LRTPAGTECPHYFQDFQRGRTRQECRLIATRRGGAAWRPDDCRNCPIPRILLSNACPKLMLTARVSPGLVGIGRRVEVQADCLLSQGPVAEPEVGCGRCHESLTPLDAPEA
jgi:hypothetical protein